MYNSFAKIREFFLIINSFCTWDTEDDDGDDDDAVDVSDGLRCRVEVREDRFVDELHRRRRNAAGAV